MQKNRTKVDKILIKTKSNEMAIREAIALADAVNFTRDMPSLMKSSLTKDLVVTPSSFRAVFSKKGRSSNGRR